ncbi:MobQ family relaxase [Falsiroseomonas sp. CW058]|uniref:MobQ family relaxase n=1 Tax=Falsiroseomonas sp. CW058 TaxID=3388664 RepID=UPI003D32406B
MACYHLTLKFMSRKSGEGHSAVHGVAYRSGNRGATISTATKVGGVSAVAAAAYRSGQAIQDERLGQTYDYRNKDAILHTEIVLPEGPVPAWATDRNQLWNEVEKAEKRKDATVAREVEVMLPRELGLPQQLALVRRFIAQEVTAKGLVADFSIHRPNASDGQPHPHCHIMITPRALEAQGFAARKDETFRWSGQGEKSKDALVSLREAWARLQNDALAEAGSASRVDHRTLVAQRTEALVRAKQARQERRPVEAAIHQRRAAELHRAPKQHVPFVILRRLVGEIAAHLRQRIERWAGRNRARQYLAAMADAGLRVAEEEIGSLVMSAGRALGLDPPPRPAPNRLPPRLPPAGLAYER